MITLIGLFCHIHRALLTVTHMPQDADDGQSMVFSIKLADFGWGCVLLCVCERELYYVYSCMFVCVLYVCVQYVCVCA